MLRLSDIKLALDHSEKDLLDSLILRLQIKPNELMSYSVFKRSYDARKRNSIFLVYQVDVNLCERLENVVLEKHPNSSHINKSPDSHYYAVAQAPENFPSENQQKPIVIGFGPCGLMTALLLAQMGFKPIVLERGKEVRERTKDTWKLWRNGQLNTESNVQFGEGGAGTFSDGKLYSQVKDKRFLGRKVLNEFVKAGAPNEILILSKPHIGTFKLVKMVENIRAEIIRLGGEIRFKSKVDGLIHEEIMDSEPVANSTQKTRPPSQITGVKLANGDIINSRQVVLAIGHSARDTFKNLYQQGVYMEAKPFSIGFRIEHPQSVIDKARFGKQAGHSILGAADYKLVHHCKNGRTVYSFCMCPGGTVVAATSEKNAVVTNGMSQYSRNERNANSAIVVGITPEQDYSDDVFAGVELQRKLESLAYKMGGENYHAPAQRVGDFLQQKQSAKDKNIEVAASYQPGTQWCDLSKSLPDYAIEAIREAIPAFDKKIAGFAMDDAILTAVETRTSSPICIKRDKTYQSINSRGLYPAGEGAGYAGGILSAAIDGVKIAEAVALSLSNYE